MKDEYILGISCLYHDSAASIIKNDKIVAAAQEERFTRKKFDDRFPDHAIAYCLAEAGIGINDVTYFGFYEKPLIKFERILETYLDIVPRGARTFTKAIPLWMKEKLWIPEMIKKKTGYKGKIIFLQHHLSHAASSYLCSPFDEAAIITFDAVGEWTTTAYGVGSGNNINLIKEIKFPNSLGMFYSAFTYYLGFKVDSGEYKVMGAAPYGKPTYYDLIKDEMIKVYEDGSFKVNLKYFGFLDSEKMINENFEELFGAPARGKSEMNEKYFDIANSVQKVTEEIMMNAANYVREETGMKNLCLAGGTALNSVANGRILKECGYDDVYIQPAAGDAGGALGTSMYIYYKILNHNKGKSTIFETPYLGPAYSDEQIENVLSRYEAVYKKMEYWDLLKKTARLISERNVVAWFQGRFEWGPRALGNRSILADPRYEEMKEELNSKIKFRESFRPFAPSILAEKVSEYFELDREAPYMLLVVPVKEDKKSVIPAITHVDGTARPQSVSRKQNPIYYDLINEFYKITGVPVVINTSFNIRGEPIINTPEEAYKCFMRTGLDYLVMGNFILDKKEQKPWKEAEGWQSFLQGD